jgi:Leucine-rich repeat (LRR) protein
MPDFLAFHDVDALINSVNRIQRNTAAIAKGMPFQVGGLMFKIKWARDYTAAYVKPLKQSRQEAGVRVVERNIASRLTVAPLLDAATLSICDERVLHTATVASHIATGGLLKIHGMGRPERLLRIDWAKNGSGGKWVDITETRLPSWRRFLRFLSRGLSGTKSNRDFTIVRAVKGLFDLSALSREYGGERHKPAASSPPAALPLPPLTEEQRRRTPSLAGQLTRMGSFFSSPECQGDVSADAIAVASAICAWAQRMEREISAIDNASAFDDLSASLSLLNDLVPWIQGAESVEQRDKRLHGVGRIWSCSGGSNVLDLDYLGLTSLPENLFQHLRHLVILKLDFNKLSTLPASISTAHRLEVISVQGSTDRGGARLVALPDTIGDLPHLHTLNLSSQALSTLPDSMRQLRRLRILRLESNRFTSYPPALMGLHHDCVVTPSRGVFAGATRSLDTRSTRAARGRDDNAAVNAAPRLAPPLGTMPTRISTIASMPQALPSRTFTPNCTLSRALLEWYPEKNEDELEELCALWDSVLLHDAATVRAEILAGARFVADTRVRHLPPGTEPSVRNQTWARAYRGRIKAAEETVETTGAVAFAMLLQRLRDTKEYIDASESRRTAGPGNACAQWDHYVSRIQRVIDTLRQDVETRAQCFGLAKEGLGTCGDRVALTFNEIESECLVHALDAQYAGQSAESLLRARIEVGKKYYRVRRLDEAVALHIQELRTLFQADFGQGVTRGFDEPFEEAFGHAYDFIGIRLKYQVRCGERGIEFPVPLTKMRFPGIVDIDDAQVNTAILHIQSGERDKSLVIMFFAMELPFWRRHLEAAFPERFAAATRSIQEEMKALSELASGGDDDGDSQRPEDGRDSPTYKDAQYFRQTYLQGGERAAQKTSDAGASRPQRPDSSSLTELEYADVLDAINARTQQIKVDLYKELTAEVLA